MKRYGGDLFERMITYTNIKKAIKNSQKGKKKTRAMVKVKENLHESIMTIHRMLKYGEYIPSQYKTKIIKDKTKTREILVTKYFPDRIIHHCILQIIEPILRKSFIPNTYQCIKGRGVHKGIRDVQKFVKNKHDLKYIKVDIQKFYQSVNITLLKNKLNNKFKDKKALNLIFQILESSPQGLPIGNYTSQIFSNFFMNEIDHYMVDKFKDSDLKYYRYADDIIMLSHNFNILNKIFNILKTKLFEHDLKHHIPIKGHIKNGLDYIGVNIRPTHTLIRKRIELQIKKLYKLGFKRYLTNYDYRRICSYYGYINYTNSYNLWVFVMLYRKYDGGRLLKYCMYSFCKRKNINFFLLHKQFTRISYKNKGSMKRARILIRLENSHNKIKQKDINNKKDYKYTDEINIKIENQLKRKVL